MLRLDRSLQQGPNRDKIETLGSKNRDPKQIFAKVN